MSRALPVEIVIVNVSFPHRATVFAHWDLSSRRRGQCLRRRSARADGPVARRSINNCLMNNYHVEPIGGVFIGYYGNGESRDPANKALASGRSVVGKRGKSVKRRHDWGW